MLYDFQYVSDISWFICTILQNIDLKLLVQPSSSSTEGNWSAYSFVHSKKSKITIRRVEELIFIHGNLCLLPRKLDLIPTENPKWGYCQRLI